VTQEYSTYLFRMHTYFVAHEDVPNEESIMRQLDIQPVSVTLKEDHNTVDGENPIELIMNIQMKNNR